MTPSLLFRADGSATIGAGHVMRCLALAQAWQGTGGRALFLQSTTTPALVERLRAAGCESIPCAGEPGSAADAEETVRQAHAAGATWVVGDGYHFGAAWQRQVRAAGLRLLLLDDYGHADHYHADVVLNQNLSADAALYAQREAHTRLLLGPRYVLLRSEFLCAASPARDFTAPARKVLVTLGGSDPDNVTARVVAALRAMTDIEAVVVVGGSNPHLAALRAAFGPASTEIRLVEDATNMPELMAWADVAVSAAGSTVWELAYMGLPAILVVLAENQRPIAAELERRGVSVSVGDHSNLDEGQLAVKLHALISDRRRRQDASLEARQLLDGHGASRVIAAINLGEVTLRRASRDDCRRLWEWANDPVVRMSSFNPEPIPWEMHTQWLDEKLRNPRTVLFIGLDADGAPFGQARFDWDEAGAVEMAVSVDHNRRKSGFGSTLISRAVEAFFAVGPRKSVTAYIKPENRASIGAFSRAGFTQSGHACVKGHEAVRMTITAPGTGNER